MAKLLANKIKDDEEGEEEIISGLINANNSTPATAASAAAAAAAGAATASSDKIDVS